MQNNHAVILQACLKSIKNVHKKYEKYPTEWALSLLQCITFLVVCCLPSTIDK